MSPDQVARILRFYFITDDQATDFPALAQVRLAVEAGATVIQYRNKSFCLAAYEEVAAICGYCREVGVPFLVNDHVLLAKAVGADGVHVGQEDASPLLARRILGPAAIVGVSVSTPTELGKTDLSVCDYVGTGPVFPTGTKADAKKVRGLKGLKEIVDACRLPAVAIGGIDAVNAPGCFLSGASGVAVISSITRAQNPVRAAHSLAHACAVAVKRANKDT